MRNRSSRVRKPSTAPYIKAGKWHTFSGSEPIVDGMQIVPLPGHTPGHTGYEFSSKGQKILFWATSSMHSASSCSIPRSPRFSDTDQTAAAATRHQLLSKARSRGCFDRGAAYVVFSCPGPLAQGWNGL